MKYKYFGNKSFAIPLVYVISIVNSKVKYFWKNTHRFITGFRNVHGKEKSFETWTEYVIILQKYSQNKHFQNIFSFVYLHARHQKPQSASKPSSKEIK